MLLRVFGPLADYVVRLAYRYRSERWLSAMKKTGFVQLRMPLEIYDAEKIECGGDVAFGEFCHIRANGGLRIGSRVMIASHVVITTRSHPTTLPRYAIPVDAPIQIGDDVWIGAGAVILPGVSVGDGAVVAAGAVVSDTVPPHCVVAGVPARVIRQLRDQA
ncbi:MAG TPA: acyltransferase [Vicinamibacterales bacterium]|nr:acyltransferase [Vicinamibacterales bacterium]